MTLSKLSIRNAKRQAKDYLVYFVTVVMAAAFIYAFNGLVFSDELRNLSNMMESLPMVVVFASVVVVGIIGWLVSYTTKFMLARRSRELGTYILIGLENRQVARLFFLENLAVGAVALLLGMLLGSLLFQALRAITLTLFHVPYSFSLAFSGEAVCLSLFYFALIYLYALIKSHRTINKMKIRDLLYLDQQNEGAVIHKQRTRRRTFFISIVLGVVGTLLLLLSNLALGLLGTVLLILALYGFFVSFSSGVPEYFQKRPALKFEGCNLLVFRTLSAKLATMGVVMATIALLFTATLIAEGSGLVFNALFESRAADTTCFDLYIATSRHEDSALERYHAYIEEHIPTRATYDYNIYQSDQTQVMNYIESNAEYYRMFDFDTMMKASDYTALRAMLGYPAAELAPGQYVIHCMAYLDKVMRAYDHPFKVGGQTLTPGGVYTERFSQALWDGNGRGFILVVPDDVLEGQQPILKAYAAMTEQPVTNEDFQALRQLRDFNTPTEEWYETLFSKENAETESAAMCATIVFPLYYLALVLTMVAATILTIHQLSESDRYRRQFRLLDSLGMERHEMNRALRTQFAIFYAMPALPPMLIGIPFVLGLCRQLDPGVLSSPGQIAAIIAVTLALFFSIYLIYILAAYTSLKRSVLPD